MVGVEQSIVVLIHTFISYLLFIFSIHPINSIASNQVDVARSVNLAIVGANCERKICVVNRGAERPVLLLIFIGTPAQNWMDGGSKVASSLAGEESEVEDGNGEGATHTREGDVYRHVKSMRFVLFLVSGGEWKSRASCPQRPIPRHTRPGHSFRHRCKRTGERIVGGTASRSHQTNTSKEKQPHSLTHSFTSLLPNTPTPKTR